MPAEDRRSTTEPRNLQVQGVEAQARRVGMGPRPPPARTEFNPRFLMYTAASGVRIERLHVVPSFQDRRHYLRQRFRRRLRPDQLGRRHRLAVAAAGTRAGEDRAQRKAGFDDDDDDDNDEEISTPTTPSPPSPTPLPAPPSAATSTRKDFEICHVKPISDQPSRRLMSSGATFCLLS